MTGGRHDEWPPVRLTERFRSIEKDFDGIDKRIEIFMDALEPLTELPDRTARAVNREVDQLRGEIQATREACEAFWREYQADKRVRVEERNASQLERAKGFFGLAAAALTVFGALTVGLVVTQAISPRLGVAALAAIVTVLLVMFLLGMRSSRGEPR